MNLFLSPATPEVPPDLVRGSPSDTGAPAHDFVDLAGFPLGFDIRYARADNFLGRAVYPAPHAFLQRPVAEALLRAHDRLGAYGFGVLVFDGYRPWKITKLFYDEATENQREFLANPGRGSLHNRGCAVDCSLFRLKDGREAVMPSEFDEMNERAWAAYAGGDPEARRLRDLLIKTMHAEGFGVLEREWWHFNHPAAVDYPIYDWGLEDLARVLAPKA